MAAIPGGVPIAGFISPTDSSDTYPVIDPLYGIDGYRSVADHTIRNAIPDARRRFGMMVFTQNDSKNWTLDAGPWAGDDTDWTEFTGGGGGGMTIGDVVSGGSEQWGVLFMNASFELSQSPLLTFNSDPTAFFYGICDWEFDGDGDIEGSLYIDVDLEVAGDVDFYGSQTWIESTTLLVDALSTFTDDVAITGGLTVTDTSGVAAAITGQTVGVQSLTTYAAGGTLASMQSVLIKTSTKTGGGTVTVNYGLDIENQTAGSTNRAIRTGAGLLEFRDVASFGDSAAPDNSQILTLADAGATTGLSLENFAGNTTIFAELINGAGGNVIEVASTITGNGAAVRGVEILGDKTGGTTGELLGLYIGHGVSGAGVTADDVIGIRINTTSVAGAGAVVTNDRGLYIFTPQTSGGGAITNHYGIDIQNQVAAGVTNSWAIRTGTGLVQFGDILKTANKIHPGTDAAALQTACGLYANTGAPNNANGANGDIYFRADGGALTTVYQRRAGAWVGIV